MRRGDAQHRCAARSKTSADHPWSARAQPARVCARSAVPSPERKRKLSLGDSLRVQLQLLVTQPASAFGERLLLLAEPAVAIVERCDA